MINHDGPAAPGVFASETRLSRKLMWVSVSGYGKNELDLMNIKKKVLWSVGALLLAVLTMAAVTRGSGMSMKEAADALMTASPAGLFPALVCMLGFIVFEGEAVLSIVRHVGYPRRHRQGFIYSAADLYFSAITPSATGGQPASLFFMVSDGIPAPVAAASLLANLIAYNAAILTIGFVCLIIRPAVFMNFQPGCKLLIVAGFLVLTGMGICFFLLLWRQNIIARVGEGGIRFLSRHHLMKHPDKYRKKLRHTMEEYGKCVSLMAGKRWMWVQAYLFNLLQRTSQILVTVFCLKAVGGNTGLSLRLFVTQTFVAIGSNCVPIPGSMGVTDYLMLDGYMNLMDKGHAYRLQMLSRGISFYFCVLLCGAVALGGWLLLRHRAKKGTGR